MDKFLHYLKNHKLYILLDVILIVLFFSPYSMTGPGDEPYDPNQWEYHPIYSDIFMMAGYFPLLFLTLAYQIVQHKQAKKVLMIILLSYSGMLSLNALIARPFLDSQDYIPHLGTYLLIAVFPINLLIFRKDTK